MGKCAPIDPPTHSYSLTVSQWNFSLFQKKPRPRCCIRIAKSLFKLRRCKAFSGHTCYKTPCSIAQLKGFLYIITLDAEIVYVDPLHTKKLVSREQLEITSFSEILQLSKPPENCPNGTCLLAKNNYFYPPVENGLLCVLSFAYCDLSFTPFSHLFVLSDTEAFNHGKTQFSTLALDS